MDNSYSVEETLFAEALERPVAERGAFLRGRCGADEELRWRVAALLREHDVRQPEFLEAVALSLLDGVDGQLDTPTDESLGARIGRYTLLEKIGEGGCGVVFLAQQEEPVRRQVALKIIKLGMDTREVIARFEAERQALALMDHPNIARVFDAGATASGRPFFVMELVEGVMITRYCDDARLSVEERLAVFIEVCRAIQHAHQKGVIHRDIKPSNILVMQNDGPPIPKVIDFGVAKATEAKLTDKTLVTAFAHFIGTPAYTSPEQAGFDACGVDTRSDVYSLGVLLYELLTGRTPFDAKELAHVGFDEMRRRIREEEPARPSARLTNLPTEVLVQSAAARHTEPSRLVSQVKGELDWIVLRCLDKDRARRYETANALTEDIRHYLQHEPVSAMAPSRSYLLRKLLRRHRYAVAMSGAVAVTLLAGATVSTLLFFRERGAYARAAAAERKQYALRDRAEQERNTSEIARETAERERLEADLARQGAERARNQAEAEKRRAETEAAKSAAASRFLEQMLGGIEPTIARGRDTILLHEILDRAAERLDRELPGQPEIQSDLRRTIGNLYQRIGERVRGEALLRGALAQRRQIYGSVHLKVAESLNDVGSSVRGKSDEAESLIREAIAIQRQLLGSSPQLAESLRVLAMALSDRGKHSEADAATREGLQILRDSPRTKPMILVKSLTTRGRMLRYARRYAEADVVFEEALALCRQYAGPETQFTVDQLKVEQGANFVQSGRGAEAEAVLKEELASRRSYDQGSQSVGFSLSYLREALTLQLKREEAKAVAREELALWQRWFEREPESADNRRWLARLLRVNGRYLREDGNEGEAETLFRRAEEVDGGR